MFRNYHYLNHDLNYASDVYVLYVNGDEACFSAVLPAPGIIQNVFRGHRTVVLPDFQGLNLSKIISEYIGELYYKKNKYYTSVTTHPGLIKYRMKLDSWKLRKFDKIVKKDNNFENNLLSYRLKASFLYIPKKLRNKI